MVQIVDLPLPAVDLSENKKPLHCKGYKMRKAVEGGFEPPRGS